MDIQPLCPLKSILEQIEGDVVAVYVDRPDGELIALFQLQWCAGGDGYLGVVVNRTFSS